MQRDNPFSIETALVAVGFRMGREVERAVVIDIVARLGTTRLRDCGRSCARALKRRKAARFVRS